VQRWTRKEAAARAARGIANTADVCGRRKPDWGARLPFMRDFGNEEAMSLNRILPSARISRTDAPQPSRLHEISAKIQYFPLLPVSR
jgi:hypothetical protein